MKIEGLGDNTRWFSQEQASRANAQSIKPDELKIGGEIFQNNVGNNNPDGYWIITDVLGDGKFKAVPKENWEDFANNGDDLSETFDISGKVDTSNPIYKFYEKEVGKYLKNKYGATLITDPQGVQWWEVNVKPEHKKLPVEAFAVGTAVGIGASQNDN